MADQQNDKGNAAAKDAVEAPDRSSRKQAQADSVSAEDKFEVADLIARSSDFFEKPGYVVAGALHGQQDPISLDDGRARIESWLSKPVIKEA